MEPVEGSLFVYGPLSDQRVQRLALGRVPDGELAVACGWSLRAVRDHPFPMAVKDGQECAGQILTGLSTQEVDVLARWDADWFTRHVVIAATSTLGPTVTGIVGASPSLVELRGLEPWDADSFDVDSYLTSRQERAA